MKLFHETNIKLYSKKSQPKICIASDIHFSYQVKNEKLESLRKKLEARKPDYIFIPGDLVDSNDMIEKESEKVRLLNWLESLGKIATVLISEGNHDTYKRATKERTKATGDKWDVIKNVEFIKRVNQLENVHYLDNQVYEDKNIYVLGLTLSSKYYCLLSSEKQKNVSPTGENVEQLLKELDDLDQKLITNLPKNKLTFALIHSPCHLSDFRVKAELKEFDYLISGHMHNGLVTPVLDELWRSDHGVVNASKHFVAGNTRLSRKTLKEGLIITGAITTWHESVGFLHNLNLLYPAYFTTLEFTKETRFEKPYVSKKYLNY
jgi:predicted MPP superfamily phosphohydrolase